MRSLFLLRCLHHKHLTKVIKNHSSFFYVNSEVRAVFTPVPFVLFSTPCDFWGHSVQFKFYFLKRKPGSQMCNIVCYLRRKNGLSLVYLKLCKVCGKQYGGSTVIDFDFDGIAMKEWRSHWTNSRFWDYCFGKTDLSDCTRRDKVWKTKLRPFPTNVFNVKE